MTSVETLEAPSVGAPPEPMQQHVVDRLVAGGHAERTLCGKLWDRTDLKPAGQLCKGCERVLVERGHAHLIPHIGRQPGGES